MGSQLPQAIEIHIDEPKFEFSICTLVTRKDEYQEMMNSFLQKGFDAINSEFLFVDNSVKNHLDGYAATNQFLAKAKGKFIIICHQDIILHKDGIDELRQQLIQLDSIDPNWAICGNAGAAGPNHIVYHISYPDGTFMNKGKLPMKVQSLDENFILVKNNAHLRVSTDLQGFHLYATDLILQASLNGFTSYVIPFNLIHKSKGNKNEAFFIARKLFIKKYNNFFRTRWIQTNSTIFHLSGNFVGRLFGNKFFLFFVRMRNSIKKKL